VGGTNYRKRAKKKPSQKSSSRKGRIEKARTGTEERSGNGGNVATGCLKESGSAPALPINKAVRREGEGSKGVEMTWEKTKPMAGGKKREQRIPPKREDSRKRKHLVRRAGYRLTLVLLEKHRKVGVT